MKKFALLLFLMVFSVLLVACNIESGTKGDNQDDTVTLGDEYNSENIISSLGDTYYIKVAFYGDDLPSEYVVAKSGDKELYMSDYNSYFIEGDSVYELDLEAKTKTLLDEYMHEIVLLSHEMTFIFLVEWAESINNIAKFVKNDTYLGRSVQIYSWKASVYGVNIETNYTIDNETKIALKFEYLTSEGDVSWEVTEFKLTDVSLTTYLNYQTVS